MRREVCTESVENDDNNTEFTTTARIGYSSQTRPCSINESTSERDVRTFNLANNYYAIIIKNFIISNKKIY